MVYRDKFVSEEQVDGVLRLVAESAKARGIIAAVIGGVAMQLYGSTRNTTDVDFAMSEIPEELAKLQKLKSISFGGARYTAPNGAKLDLIVRNDEYKVLYEDALANAMKTPDGIVVVSPEHLAAMKLAAGREKDILDLKWIIRQPDLLDVQVAKKLIYRTMGRFAQDRFMDIVDSVNIQGEIDRRRSFSQEEE